ncbi:MAG: 3-phosphoserine/phosphohydroxythreonine transaminase [Deltaproteobacteria bacterium]|nr:3-phosphoserine/phosphohydroxythreonine transaminase [Deltaproteobacteria bacterium]MCB9788312.1 3-phosphoserine/phosphohydroxythreonine transaminase [Deltaproteobacteria bacterium]
MQSARPINFSPGPAILPLSVLEEAARGLVALEGLGLSILEISHRSPTFEAILAEARDGLRRLLDVPDSHEILFLQGGARGQFAQIPLNFLIPGSRAAIVVTGVWGEGAFEEAQRLGDAFVLATGAESRYAVLPDLSEVSVPEGTAYVHTTSNNTVVGSQWHPMPDFGPVPHISDMSSDILSRPIDVSRYALIYAGAQKNMGPSGLTVVIIDRRFMAAGRSDIPEIWQYRAQAAKDSMLNTPPTFAIYVLGLVTRWLEERGGVAAMAQENAAKAAAVYGAIEASGGFYRPAVTMPDHRSQMNVTFRIADEALEKRFVAEAEAAGLVGLKGHRIVGGLRASLYNAMPLAGAQRLAAFMDEFARARG